MRIGNELYFNSLKEPLQLVSNVPGTLHGTMLKDKILAGHHKHLDFDDTEINILMKWQYLNKIFKTPLC